MAPALACIALCAALATSPPAVAAALGQATVRSALGQHLDAEIDIAAPGASEADTLIVRIAPPEAFAAAGIEMTPLVRSLRLAIERSGDRTFVRLSSDQAVLDPYLMLLVELNASNARMVRQYALLIDPAPIGDRPAAPPIAAEAAPLSSPPAASPSDGQAAQAAQAAPTRPVKRGETLAAISAALKPDGVRLEQVMVALHAANPTAFAGNNMNRMKSGSVLSVPSADRMRALSIGEARRIVVAQSVDFQRYREALASRPSARSGEQPATGAEAGASGGGNRSSSGSVGVQINEPGASEAPRDKLTLTAPGNEGGSGSNSREAVDKVAADKALADANSRIAALENNIGQLRQMLQLQDRKLAEAQQAAEARQPAEPSSAAADAPASPPAVAAPPVPARPDQRSPAPWALLLADPFVRTLAAASLLLSLLAWLTLRRRSRPAVQQQPAAAPAHAAATTVVATTAAAHGPAERDQARLTSVGDPTRNGEVDPVAEADVYIAYGRDEQAEEILLDALRAHPERHALRVKLLEIYAARRDHQRFGNLAAELRMLTAGQGSAWQQAARLGRLLEPGNALYDTSSTASAAPSAAAPASVAEDFGLKLEGMLDERRRELGSGPALMQAVPAAPAQDFGLAGIAPEPEPEPRAGQRIEPRLDDEPDTAALHTKLDLALACKDIGDHQGARELLAEVAAARHPELASRAQSLLSQLA